MIRKVFVLQGHAVTCDMRVHTALSPATCQSSWMISEEELMTGVIACPPSSTSSSTSKQSSTGCGVK